MASHPTQGFRCAAVNRAGGWEALCTDLDLAVGGASYPEARESLQAAVELYLEEAATADGPDRQYLLTRRSPWTVRMGLAVRGLAARAGVGVRDVRTFTVAPMPWVSASGPAR